MIPITVPSVFLRER